MNKMMEREATKIFMMKFTDWVISVGVAIKLGGNWIDDRSQAEARVSRDLAINAGVDLGHAICHISEEDADGSR